MATEKERELLFVHGFTTLPEYQNLTDVERKTQLRRADKEIKDQMLNPKNLNIEVLETADGHFDYTSYPESASYQRVVWETVKNNLEDTYYWLMEHLRQDRAFHKVIKITDLYAASEASAFWGNQQQRISAQQNNAQGLLANIGKFVKELFQMVRELRIIDERLDMYVSWNQVGEDGTMKRSEAADVSLKSLFTDQVEGGTKNPQSVFGLAQTVGFTLLPDLFFNTRVYSEKDLDTVVDALDLNQVNKNMLRRKLYQFLIWKQKTHKELETRREFNI